MKSLQQPHFGQSFERSRKKSKITFEATISPRVKGGRNKMDPDTTNCVILRIHVDQNNIS